jgi:hypothetical protein
MKMSRKSIEITSATGVAIASTTQRPSFSHVARAGSQHMKSRKQTLNKHGNIPIPMTVAAPPFTVQGANSNNIINALLGQPAQESRASIGQVESSVKNTHRKQVLQNNSSAAVVGTGLAAAETPQFYEQRMMNGRNERRHLQPSIAS